MIRKEYLECCDSHGGLRLWLCEVTSTSITSIAKEVKNKTSLEIHVSGIKGKESGNIVILNWALGSAGYAIG